MLSIEHDLKVLDTRRKNKRNEKVLKPKIIMCYYEEKQGIGLSDSMASCLTPLQNTIRWYHKIGFEFLLNTAVVNTLIIYKEIRGVRKVQIAKFKHDLIYSLTEIMHFQHKSRTQTICSSRSSATSTATHYLEKHSERDNKNRLKRKRCFGCCSEIKKNALERKLIRN